MKLAANISMLWAELPFLDRFDAAADAGFKGVEVHYPYDVAAKETQAALGRNGLEMVLINAPPPNYTGGPRGFAAEPDKVMRFQSDMRRSFRYAQAMGVAAIHVLAGQGKGTEAETTLIDNLRWAASQAPKGITLLLEPLNKVAAPEYFLNDYAQAARQLRAIDAPNVGLQFDSYHAQMIHGDAVAVFEEYAPLIRHIQLGDAPDRGALGLGDVDFKSLLAAVKRTGFKGWIGAEYHPNGPTEKTLDWMQTL